MDGPYLYLEGLHNLAAELSGSEKVFMGIRPYDLHAGNVLSIVAYPYLLCDALKKGGIEPNFNFVVSINDWEQSDWAGKDVYKYPFDVRPKHQTIAHTMAISGLPMVDKWQPRIEQEVSKVKKKFPGVTIDLVRNSNLKNHQAMKRALQVSIRDRHKIKAMLLQASHSKTLGEEMYFANAICSKCLSADTNTNIINELFHTICSNCGFENTRVYKNCDYWLHYKLLFPPRLEIFKFDVSISGADHLLSGDFTSRRLLFEYIYKKPMPQLKMLFAPLIVTENNEKMSKSRQNHFYMPLEEVVAIAKNDYNATIRVSPSKLT